MYKTVLTSLFLGWIPFLAIAQSDTLKDGKVQYGKVGLKVTPTQFLVGEKAATVELKLWNTFSTEVKLGVFGKENLSVAPFYMENSENWTASGYLLQTGFKYYYPQKKGIPNLSTPKEYQGFYWQVLALYKRGKVPSQLVSTGSGEDPYRMESSSFHTYGLKVQFGYEWQFFKYGYLDVYGGIGARVRRIHTIIAYDSRDPKGTYPVDKRESRSYPSPQLGVNIGFLVPFKK